MFISFQFNFYVMLFYTMSVKKRNNKNITRKKKGGALVLPAIGIGIIATLIKPFIVKKEDFDYNLGREIEVTTDELRPCTEKISIPSDYQNDDSVGEVAKRTASFVSQRAGLSLADGVDRLIFKNQDYLELFSKEYLFNKGYYGSTEEYKNLLKSGVSSTFLNSRNNSPIMYPGTRVNVKIPGFLNSNMVARLVKKTVDGEGKFSYIVEYKKKIDQKSWSNLVSSSAKNLTGMTELYQLENPVKEMILKSDGPTLPFSNIELNDTKECCPCSKETPSSGGDATPPDVPVIQNPIIDEQEQPMLETIIEPQTQINDATNSNPYYKQHPCPIPAELVTKNMSSAVPLFYKLNEEFNIPFENPDMFIVFHMLKYQFKKTLNLARINLLYHILNSFGKAMRQNEAYYSTLKGLSYPEDPELQQNLKAAETTPSDKIAKFTTETDKQLAKEKADDDKETEVATPVQAQNAGKKRTTKSKRYRKNKTKKITKGGLHFSGTVDGDVGVINDKISKYIFGKNLRTPEWRDKPFNDKHPLKYVEEEQKMFLALAILYYKNMTNAEQKQKYDEIFMDLNPFSNYLDESQNKDLTNDINTELVNHEGKTPYQMVLILADLVWPNRNHQVGQLGGLFNIPNMGIRKSLNTKIQYVGESIAKNNMFLNKIFDYAFKRMVFYRLKTLFVPITVTAETKTLTREQKNSLYETVNFYRKIKFSTISSSHFTCTTASNVALGVISNPFAGAMGYGAAVTNLPHALHTVAQLNTPQCYIATLLCAYVLFFM
jgi:hypothetical protein